jgi:predicted RNase H-like HicB family nuclease/predicted RNA binding protein YcfA (HicA-like mRNA interferase family)
MASYRAILEREGDGYVATCAELDVISQGNTAEEAMDSLKEAIELFLETASESEILRRLHSEIPMAHPNDGMDKLRVMSGREVCTILAQHGFDQVCQRGSHIIMQSRLPDTTITIRVPDRAELRGRTLMGIIRQSGAPRTEFEQ